MGCIEAPLDLAGAIRQSPAWRDAAHLLVIDCLTLWLSNAMFAPAADEAGQGAHADWPARIDDLHAALAACAGPIVLVSNEIGLGVVPLGAETRAYVDALGRLNQQVAARCDRVCLMVAGLPLFAKGS
jgi:adenosylcobinamide kinase/adenosylcobinamide-phosphate guanylyltransferase